MADLRISELQTLAGANLAAGDFLPVADVSASESKKITTANFVANAVTLIADDTIPSAKILFAANSVSGSGLQDGTVTASKLLDNGVTGSKLADDSSAKIVAALPPSGDFVGQIAVEASGSTAYIWNGSTWATFKASGNVNTVVGSSAGPINIEVSTVGSTVTISTSLDDTTAAGEFLAGPSGTAGAVSYRTIVSADLPTASTTSKGAVAVNGNGLTLSGDQIQIDNSITPSSADYHVVQYDANGLITDGRQLTGSDMPIAAGGVVGAVAPGTGLSVNNDGEINHTNSTNVGTYTKVTVDAEGHVTTGDVLAAEDIPALDASKIETGALVSARYGDNSVTGAKLANLSVTQIGGSDSTQGVVTFPVAEFTGQYFFDAINNDLYLWDGNAWQAITITAGEIIYAGTFDASAGSGTGEVASLTTAGQAIGLVVGNPLPAASETNNRYYLVVSVGGTITSGAAPNVALSPPDMLLSNGSSWEEIDVSTSVTGATQASNITFTPAGGIQANNVQSALAELGTGKIGAGGATITGELLIGTTGALAFEGSTDNAYETYLAATDATADRTITLPDVTGTVITTGDTGTVTSAMLAGSIALNKLVNLTSGNIIVGSSGNVPTAVAVSGDVTINNAGVTAIATGAIINADVSASAAIAFSKLASLNNGAMLVGNGSNVATAVTPTGDVTISNAGVTSISSGVIVNADINANAEIAVSKLADGDARQLLQTDAAGTGVEWASNIDIPGTLDVTGVGTFDAATRGAISTLSDGASITPNFATANHFSVTLGGNRTLANPSNVVAGQSGCIWITQDGTGSRTLAYGADWEFTGGTAPTLSTAAGAVDCLVYAVQSATKITATLITNLS